MVNNLNTKYAGLSETEQRIIKSGMGNDEDEKKTVFVDVIRECVDTINENLLECDINTKEKLLTIKDKLLRMSFVSENFINDVSKIIELKKDLIS